MIKTLLYFIIGVSVLSFPFALASCKVGKVNIIDVECRFEKAYCKWPDGTVKVIEIIYWKQYMNNDEIKIVGKDGTVYLLHSSNVVLTNK